MNDVYDVLEGFCSNGLVCTLEYEEPPTLYIGGKRSKLEFILKLQTYLTGRSFYAGGKGEIEVPLMKGRNRNLGSVFITENGEILAKGDKSLRIELKINLLNNRN